MPQEILRQSNWTGGELDPQMLGRRDLKAYFASAASLENHVVMPQGPLLRRPGLAFVDRIRNPLDEVVIPDGAITAPNGGDPDTARTAGDATPVTTTHLGTVDPYVILQVDFGAAVKVGLVDVIDVAVVAAGDDGSGFSLPPSVLGPWHWAGGGNLHIP